MQVSDLDQSNYQVSNPVSSISVISFSTDGVTLFHHHRVTYRRHIVLSRASKFGRKSSPNLHYVQCKTVGDNGAFHSLYLKMGNKRSHVNPSAFTGNGRDGIITNFHISYEWLW